MSNNPETLLDEMLGSLTSATKSEPVKLASITSTEKRNSIDYLVERNIRYFLCKEELTLEEISLLGPLLQAYANA